MSSLKWLHPRAHPVQCAPIPCCVRATFGTGWSLPCRHTAPHAHLHGDRVAHVDGQRLHLVLAGALRPGGCRSSAQRRSAWAASMRASQTQQAAWRMRPSRPCMHGLHALRQRASLDCNPMRMHAPMQRSRRTSGGSRPCRARGAGWSPCRCAAARRGLRGMAGWSAREGQGHGSGGSAGCAPRQRGHTQRNVPRAAQGLLDTLRHANPCASPNMSYSALSVIGSPLQRENRRLCCGCSSALGWHGPRGRGAPLRARLPRCMRPPSPSPVTPTANYAPHRHPSHLKQVMKASSSGYMKLPITIGGRLPYSLPVL